MHKNLVRKGLVLGIIVLFIGASVVPSINGDTTTTTISSESDAATSRTIINEGSLSGYVNSTLMNPIEGALVRVYFHETYEEDYSDSSGYYHVTNIPICWCLKNATASKTGYDREWVLLSIDENTTYDFVLTASAGNTLYVGGSGPGNYTKIQDAIDNASDGDTIFVFNDSSPYYENVVVDKSINLIGEDRNTTVIDGGGSGDVVYVDADWVNISGFTICNDGDTLNDAGIEICSSNNVVESNSIFDVNYGIWIRDHGRNIIRNNSCYARWDGIWLLCSEDNCLRNNYLVNCGLVLDGSSLSDFLQDVDTSNTVNKRPIYYYKNINGIKVPSDAGEVILVNCSNSEVSYLELYNVTDCIEIMYSNNNTITHNRLFNSTDYGIRMVESNYNIISSNTCLHNPSGIGFVGTVGGENFDDFEIIGDCRYNILSNNTITQSFLGIRLYASDNNFFSKNIFRNNTIHAFFWNCRNIWINNYWDKPRLLPKPIFGKITRGPFKNIPWLNIDWNPASKNPT